MRLLIIPVAEGKEIKTVYAQFSYQLVQLYVGSVLRAEMIELDKPRALLYYDPIGAASNRGYNRRATNVLRDHADKPALDLRELYGPVVLSGPSDDSGCVALLHEHYLVYFHLLT